MWNGRHAGTFGQWGAFSFYPTKNLGALGDAGALTTASEALATKARCLRNYGQSDRYLHTELGLNSRLDELQAALLAVRLEWLEQFTRRRQEIAAQYHAQVRNSKVRMLGLPKFAENHVYHLFVIRCAERDKLIRHLGKEGVQTIAHYPIAIHQQPGARNLRTDPSGLRNAELHAAECLSVPCHPQMGAPAVQRVIAALNSFR
jgi:dTDP-4-amino-4,6-dideoxygalactose transaminase